MVAEAQAGLPTVEPQLEVAGGERLAIRVPKHRQQQPPRVPVDVEMPRPAAATTPGEHVVPPGIFLGSRHVVGNDVEDQPEAVASQCRGQARSEEHTSDLQSLMRISYAVLCLQKKNSLTQYTTNIYK